MAQADFITVVQSPVQHPVPAQPPERLSLPVRLTVNELRINRVALVKDGARYEAGPIIASARGATTVVRASQIVAVGTGHSCG